MGGNVRHLGQVSKCSLGKGEVKQGNADKPYSADYIICLSRGCRMKERGCRLAWTLEVLERRSVLENGRYYSREKKEAS